MNIYKYYIHGLTITRRGRTNLARSRYREPQRFNLIILNHTEGRAMMNKINGLFRPGDGTLMPAYTLCSAQTGSFFAIFSIKQGQKYFISPSNRVRLFPFLQQKSKFSHFSIKQGWNFHIFPSNRVYIKTLWPSIPVHIYGWSSIPGYISSNDGHICYYTDGIIYSI